MAGTVLLADLAFLDLSAPRLLGFAESLYLYDAVAWPAVGALGFLFLCRCLFLGGCYDVEGARCISRPAARLSLSLFLSFSLCTCHGRLKSSGH